MYSISRTFICALIIGSITNESFVLLRSSRPILLDIWSERVTEAFTRPQFRDISRGLIHGEASRVDDYSTTNSVDDYEYGWLNLLRTLGTGYRVGPSTTASQSVAISESYSKPLIKRDDSYSIDNLDDEDEDEDSTEIKQSKEMNIPQTPAIKKPRGTIRREMDGILRELKEQINKGDKEIALNSFIKKADHHEFNPLELNFAATKVCYHYSYKWDLSVTLYYSVKGSNVEDRQKVISEAIKSLLCTVLYSTVLYSTVLYSTVLYSSLLYSALLYSTPLYSTLLYSTLLCSTLLYCTVLTYTQFLFYNCTVFCFFDQSH